MRAFISDTRYPTVREVPFLSRSGRLVLIAAFLAFLLVPLAGWLAGYRDTTDFEFRDKAPFPQAPQALFQLAEYLSKIDKYVSDSFAMRRQLLIASARLRDAVGGSLTDQVVVGRNGWLFDGHDLRHSRLVYPHRDAYVRWYEIMEQRRRWLADRGIGFIVIVGPSKHTVYPEYLPRGWKRPAQSETDPLLSYLNHQGSRIAFLDPREALQAAKSRGEIYYRYDTHWNELGGLVVYDKLVPLIQAVYPQFVPVTAGDIVWRTTPYHNHDSLRMLGLADYDDLTQVKPTFSPDRVQRSEVSQTVDEGGLWETYLTETNLSGPRILALRDSYMNAIMPYLSQSTSVFISYPHKGHEFPKELIERLHPDIVIWERIEQGVLNAGDAL
jgi:alginate O-acetyltransferase complex protein AlgJ